MSEVRVDATMVAFGCALGLCSGLLAGVLPVMRLPWRRLGDWLREGGRTGETVPHSRTRRALVVAEIALTLTIVTSAALLVKSLVAVESEDPGFRPDGVLSFRLSLPDQPYKDEAKLAAFVSNLTTRLRSLPAVARVAYAASLPPNLLDFTNNYTLEGQGRDGAGQGGVAEWNIASEDFFDLLTIPVTRGRRFVDSDRSTAAPVAIVNESFVQRALSRPRPDWQAPEGRRLGSQIAVDDDRGGGPRRPLCAGSLGRLASDGVPGVLAVALAAESLRAPAHGWRSHGSSLGRSIGRDGRRCARAAARRGDDDRARAPINDDPAIQGPALLVLRRARAGARADRRLRDHGASREPAAPRNRHSPRARRDEPADADGNTWRRASAGAGGNRAGDGRGARRHTQHGGAPLSRGSTRSRRPRRCRGGIVATAVVACIVPAFRAASIDPAAVLRDE